MLEWHPGGGGGKSTRGRREGLPQGLLHSKVKFQRTVYVEIFLLPKGMVPPLPGPRSGVGSEWVQRLYGHPPSPHSVAPCGASGPMGTKQQEGGVPKGDSPKEACSGPCVAPPILLLSPPPIVTRSAPESSLCPQSGSGILDAIFSLAGSRILQSKPKKISQTVHWHIVSFFRVEGKVVLMVSFAQKFLASF